MSTFAMGEPGLAHRKKTAPVPAVAGAEVRAEAGLGAMAMSLVHDLRTPLSVIHSGAEMLKGSQLPEPLVRRLARNMYEASVQIQELLQEYADRCRTTLSQPQRSYVRDLVGEAVDRISATAEAQSVVVVQDVPADLSVTVDERRIRSVLTNLLANALEAMPSGGSIEISTMAAEDSVVIRVRDTGPGIAPEIHDRLFQPFVTAGKPSGWGLGLAQARQVVVDHGGEMWLESPSGKGACLAFSLPAW